MTSRPITIRTPSTGFLLVLCLCLHSGCSQFTPTSTSPDSPQTNTSGWFGRNKKTKSEIPDRILPIWTDTVLHQPNQKGVRGFGGRVYFYKEGKDSPVPVDGNVTVYVFDGDFDSVDSTKPLKKYIITADQLEKLSSKSTLGVSYSLWIPWDEVGGASRKLNLIARFDGMQGGTVISSSSAKLLPGIDTPKNRLDIKPASGQQEISTGLVQASYLSPEQTREPDPESNTTIFSIDLPNSLEQKINAPTSDTNQPDSQQRIDSSGQSQLRDSAAGINEDPTIFNGVNSVTKVSSTDPRLSASSSNVTVGKVGSQARVIGSRLQSHFGPRRFQARSESTAPRDSYHLRMQPHPATLQNGLPPTPRANR